MLVVDPTVVRISRGGVLGVASAAWRVATSSSGLLGFRLSALQVLLEFSAGEVLYQGDRKMEESFRGAAS